MKKLSKIMLSVAAAIVVTATMAVTAMAADRITGTYDNETGVVTMDGIIGSGTSQTLLVLNNVTEVGSSADIAYFNQIDNITSDSKNFSTFKLAPGLRSETPTTYNIKIGGTNGSVQTGTLTIEAATPTYYDKGYVFTTPADVAANRYTKLTINVIDTDAENKQGYAEIDLTDKLPTISGTGEFTLFIKNIPTAYTVTSVELD